MNTRSVLFTRVVKILVLIPLLMLLLWGGSPAKLTHAGMTLWVTNTNDSGPGSFRQAVLDASPGDFIVFDGSLAGNTINLATSLIIDKDLHITGLGLSPHIQITGGGSTCDPGGSLCVIKIENGTDVNIYGLDIINGTGSGILNNGDLYITQSTISGNSSYYGGGIYTTGVDSIARVIASTVTGNNASFGGGVYGSTIVLNESVISGNTATLDGGGVFSDDSLTCYNTSIAGNIANRHGGGFYINSGLTPTIGYSLITGNNADDGGGFYNLANTLFVYDTTIYDNTAFERVGGFGGGAFNSGVLMLSHNTFSDNYASMLGGNLSNSGTISMYNNILAKHSGGGDCYNSGTISASINTLIEDGSCSPALSVDPLLKPLADNGSYTETMAIDYLSPAFNAGSPGSCVNVDQRRVPRPQGAHCDLGAYELSIYETTDFDGDDDSDISVFRPSNGRWYIQGMSSVQWAQTGDLPVPGDYDMDGTSDIAVYRPSNGKWYVKGSSPESWGTAGDIPIQADYNGDGSTDLAVLRPSNGKWYIQGVGNYSWYQSGDIPVPCDYNGDGAMDIAVMRPSNGRWYIKDLGSYIWFQSGDLPVPGDYDGNGSCDIAVYRPSNGNWYVRGQGMTSWGFPGDIPVPGDYDGDGLIEKAVLRPSNGRWYIQGMGNFSWYHTGDYPLPVRDTNADGDPYE